ncbi:hypothetical protein GHT06_021379 [Daphnia sinensis]|uniref:Uncharacterized protein n=1 Tax=Daphnia sinensis TaxID=1820382 RepID=A0AAD5PQS6_9CRUS|nr:hypothetical protein GHT06_021379 [Daphnia sinensis]
MALKICWIPYRRLLFVAVEDANTTTSPPTSPTKLPVCVVLGSSPERAAVRLRHTFSLGLTDRVKLRSSGGSPTSGSDDLPAKNSTHTLSPEIARKRFSIGSGGKRTSAASKLDSPTDIQEEAFELPAITTTTPGGHTRYDSAHSVGRVGEPAARCRAFQEDTDSLQSGQKNQPKHISQQQQHMKTCTKMEEENNELRNKEKGKMESDL